MFSTAKVTTHITVQPVTLGSRKLVEIRNAVTALVVHPSRPNAITRIGITAPMAVIDNAEFEFLRRPLANSPVGECVGRTFDKPFEIRFHYAPCQ